MAKYFHRTSTAIAAKILAAGFRDGAGTYMADTVHRGVWLSDRPLDENEGAHGDALLGIDLPARLVKPYEGIEERKPYRELLVPAAVVNTNGRVWRSRGSGRVRSEKGLADDDSPRRRSGHFWKYALPSSRRRVRAS
jgi:hypothetical protein